MSDTKNDPLGRIAEALDRCSPEELVLIDNAMGSAGKIAADEGNAAAAECFRALAEAARNRLKARESKRERPAG